MTNTTPADADPDESTADRSAATSALDVVRSLTLGTAGIANLGEVVPESQAIGTIQRAWEQGIRRYDTAPKYGSGLAEARLGKALDGMPREQIVLSTKVGATLQPGHDPESIFIDTPPWRPVADFAPDAVRIQLDQSLNRLRTDRIDIVYLHDPYDYEREAIAAFAALAQMREEGVLRQVGVGTSRLSTLELLVRECDLDVIMLSSRLTLIDASATERLLQLCLERGTRVLAAAVFNSGLLAHPGGSFNYHEAPEHLRRFVSELDRACASYHVPLRAAALQFPRRHQPVAGVVIGPRTPRQVDDLIDGAQMRIPSQLWDELDKLRTQWTVP